MKRNRWVIFLTLAALMLILSGCGVNHEGVDVINTDPAGFWQTLVVWPLAKALIYLDGFMRDANVPYHWGFAIVAFTIILRLLMFPLTLSQIRGMQAQKELQPKIQELQKKYGKDREKITQEQMKLYQEAGVNPLSGCLPLVIQMPILFGLYSALVAIGPSLAGAEFFWIPDLSFPKYTQGLAWISEAFQNGDFGLLVTYLILPALLIVSQFFMQRWMTPATPTTGNDSQAGMMKQMTYVMTFMFGFFTLQVPAGLTLYWVTSNLLQMGQQWLTTSERFNLGGPKPAIAVAGNGGTTTISALSEDTDNSATTTEPKRKSKSKPSTPKRRKRKK